MGSGSIPFLRQNSVDKKLAIFLFFITVPGVIAGACITNKIDTSNVELIPGIFTLATSFLFSLEKPGPPGRDSLLLLEFAQVGKMVSVHRQNNNGTRVYTGKHR